MKTAIPFKTRSQRFLPAVLSFMRFACAIFICAFFVSCRDREYKGELLFPCLPFSEECCNDIYEIGSENNNPIITFYAFDEIPQGYFALPVKDNGKILYASDKNYPLFRKYISYKRSQGGKIPPEKFNLCFIASCGDIILNRGIYEALTEADTAKAVFTDTMPLLTDSDYTIGNLEGAVTETDNPWPKTYRFKFHKEALKYLHEAGFDYLMMTNNHCYDYNEEGFKDTLAAVKEENFATSGVGLTVEEAEKFYETEVNETKLNILSFGAFPTERTGFDGFIHASVNEKRAGMLWKGDRVLDLIREEKEKGGTVIVNIHGGYEYCLSPSSDQIELYKAVCDAGADIIFGSHPHVLQPIEMYKNSLIVYSQGNFVFPGMDDMANATDTMVVRVGLINGRPLYFEKHLCEIKDTTVVLKKD